MIESIGDVKMIFFLGICEIPSVLKVVYFIKQLINIIRILVPIGLILMLLIDLFKSIIATDENSMKKSGSTIIKRILFAALVFLVPTIVNFAIGIVYDISGGDAHLLSCVVNADLELIKEYEKEYDEKKVAEANYWQEKIKEIKRRLEEEKAQEEERKRQKAEENASSGNSSNNSSSGNSSSGNSSSSQKYDKTIFVGDSRTVGMCCSVAQLSSNACTYGGTLTEAGTDYYMAKGSMGISWFTNTALPALKKILDSDQKYNVVINMGTNDMYDVAHNNSKSAEEYALKYNKLKVEYPNINLVIISVTQVDDAEAAAAGYYVRNSDVTYFNRILRPNLDKKVTYCDIYSKIEGKYKAPGGVHYDIPTYKLIYDEIQNCL